MRSLHNSAYYHPQKRAPSGLYASIQNSGVYRSKEKKKNNQKGSEQMGVQSNYDKYEDSMEIPTSML